MTFKEFTSKDLPDKIDSLRKLYLEETTFTHEFNVEEFINNLMQSK